MVTFSGPVEFEMGSPHHEEGRLTNEIPHRRRISRRFAVASKLVTSEQWQQFIQEQPVTWKAAVTPFGGGYAEAGVPVQGVSWLAAAQFCNWLSDKEGIPKDQWCYPEKIEPGMKLAPGHLSRTGYRLPTAAEWEYACRAGAKTAYPFGSSSDSLPRYVFFRGSSQGRPWPTGQKRPNDFGLFDVPGNVATWGHERASNYARNLWGDPIEDQEDALPVLAEASRRLRTGSFDRMAAEMRSAAVLSNRPIVRATPYGLRVARTLP